MKKLFVFMLCLSLLTACFTSRKTSENSTKANSSIMDNMIGSSFEKAVVIEETTETKGVNAEYVWLAKNYPGYTFKMQSLVDNKGKP